MRFFAVVLIFMALPLAGGASEFAPQPHNSPAVVQSDPASPKAADFEEKGVRIRDRDQVLDFAVKPEKAAYRVNESIRVQVKGDKKFYLYVLSLDENAQKATLLVPSSTQRSNRYDGEKWHPVPNKDFDFAADAPGKQHLVFIATRESLDLEKTDFRKIGAFAEADTAKAEAGFAAKGIFFRDADAHPEQEAVVRHVYLDVTGSAPASTGTRAAAAEPGDNSSLTFIAVDRRHYRSGEPITGVFGAMKPGFVHVYVVEPDGKSYPLTHGRVSGDRPQSFRAEAKRPFGVHRLAAVFSASEHMDSSAIALAPAGSPTRTGFDAKGVSLTPDQRLPEAVVSFTIDE